MGATPQQIAEAQKLIDSGDLTTADIDGLMQDFPKGSLRHNPGPVFDREDTSKSPEVSSPERFPELDSVRAAAPSHKRTAIPDEAAHEEISAPSFSALVEKLGKKFDNVDPSQVGRSHTGIPTLTKPPFYQGRAPTEVGFLTRPYAHNEPTVQNVADMLEREAKDPQNAEHIRQIAVDRLQDLQRHGRESDAYKEAADNQWVQVYNAFEREGYPVHRPAFSRVDDADGKFGATEAMLVDKTLASPLLSWAGGLDSAMTLGAGKQMASTAAPAVQSGGMGLLHHMGSATGWWDSPDYEQSERIVQRLRDQGVLPKHRGDELSQVDEMHPGSHVLGNLSSLLYGGGASKAVGEAATSAVNATQKALPWLFRGSPAVQRALKALMTGAVGGVLFGAGQEGMEAQGELMRDEPTNALEETAARAPTDALVGGAVNLGLHSAGQFGDGMQKGLRSTEGVGQNVQKLEAAGGRLGFTGLKPSEGMLGLERDSLHGVEVPDVRPFDWETKNFSPEKLVIGPEDLALNRAGDATHEALARKQGLIEGDGNYRGQPAEIEAKFFRTSRARQPQSTAPLLDAAFDILNERRGAPFADNSSGTKAIQDAMPSFTNLKPTYSETRHEDLSAANAGARAVPFARAIKAFPRLEPQLRTIFQNEVRKMAGPNATPEDLEAAKNIVSDDLTIIFEPVERNAQKVQEGMRAIDREIRYDKQRGSEDPAMRRMSAAIRQTRAQWGEDWVKDNERISKMFDRLDVHKNVVGLRGQDIDTGNRLQRETITKTIRAYQQKGHVLEDADLVRLLSNDSKTRDILKQYAGLKAYGELKRGDPSLSGKGMISRNLGATSPMRRLADPWFGLAATIGDHPATPALSSSASSSSLAQQLFGSAHRLTQEDRSFVDRLLNVFSRSSAAQPSERRRDTEPDDESEQP